MDLDENMFGILPGYHDKERKSQQVLWVYGRAWNGVWPIVSNLNNKGRRGNKAVEMWRDSGRINKL